jgi:hypothetical protein
MYGNDNKVDKHIKRKSRQFVILDNTLYNKHFTPPYKLINLLVLPRILINEVHESPIGVHTGISLIIHKLQNK